MTTEDTCPDCGRPYAKTVLPSGSTEPTLACGRQRVTDSAAWRLNCYAETIARLRAELAEARAELETVDEHPPDCEGCQG